MVHILIIIVIMNYIFLIYFGTTKTFKFQISYSFKKIIMIIKTYYIIIIDITQIIDSTLKSQPKPVFSYSSVSTPK